MEMHGNGQRPFQILSLSGGGFLGLYTISILSELESQIGRPIASCFDLLAGTSVGGIIALALALETPAPVVKSMFEDKGVSIFSDRAAPRSKLGEWRDTWRSLFRSKYDGRALREALSETLGNETLIGHLKHRVIVPTVNLTKGRPQIFKTPHHANFKRDHLLRLVDVAMATSAAPVYFPIAEIADELFTDGGLYANSPDMLALHEALQFLAADVQSVRILSIGTTTTRLSISHVGRRNLGVFGWGRKLPQVMLSAQQLDVDYMMGHRLGERYIRIDEVQSKEQERDLGLDVATLEAQKTIRGLASGSVQEVINNPRVTQLLGHRPNRPHFFYGPGSTVG